MMTGDRITYINTSRPARQLFIHVCSVRTWNEKWVCASATGRAALYVGLILDTGHSMFCFSNEPFGGYHSPSDEPVLRKYWEEICGELDIVGERYDAGKLAICRHVKNLHWMDRETMYKKVQEWLLLHLLGQGEVFLRGPDVIMGRAFLMEALGPSAELAVKRHRLKAYEYDAMLDEARFMLEDTAGKLAVVTGNGLERFDDIGDLPGMPVKYEPYRFWSETCHKFETAVRLQNIIKFNFNSDL